MCRNPERLLELSGRTFSTRVMALRLDAAHGMLADPATQHLRIGDIALASGFSDLSRFSRRFRQRFGEPRARSAAGRGTEKFQGSGQPASPRADHQVVAMHHLGAAVETQEPKDIG
jgi:hypothetical protein